MIDFNSGEKIYEGEIFSSQDFSETSLAEFSFFDCRFEHCVFINSLWNKTKFNASQFKNCNISFVKAEGCFLQDVLFDQCKIVGVEFFKCDKTFFAINIKESVVSTCNFSDLTMKRASFHKSQIKDCFFINTQLVEADFTNTDLQGTVFHKSNLNKSDFSGAINYSINLQSNTVKNAKFSYPEVMGLLKSFDIIIK